MLHVELVQIHMKKDFTFQMSWDTFVVLLLQKVYNFELRNFVLNQIKYFADEEVENELRVVLFVYLNDFFFIEVDKFVSSQPVPSVPNAFYELFYNFFVVDGGDILNQKIPFPFIGSNLVPYPFVKVCFFLGLQIGLVFSQIG